MRVGFFYTPSEELKKREPQYNQSRIYEIFMPVERRGGWGILLNLYYFAVGAFITTNGLDLIELPQDPQNTDKGI